MNIETFATKVERQANGCLLWGGALTEKGYGMVAVRREDGSKTTMQVHRWAWEQVNGPLPREVSLDHKCHTESDCTLGNECPHRRCVEVAHLEPMPLGDNIRRGRGIAGNNARKTHCPQGHEYTDVNILWVGPEGKWRRCRTCEEARSTRRSKARTARRRAGD